LPIWIAFATILPVFGPCLLAQTSPTSAALEFDQGGHDVKGFVLYATRREDGVERRIDLGLPSRAHGRFRVPLPPLEAGTWRIELTAYNGAGESPRAKANPPELHIDAATPKTPPVAKSAPVASGSGKSSPGAKSPPAAAKPPKPSPPPKNKKAGVMRKLWIVLVGADEPQGK
jgi:hypothetical protein